MKLIIAEKPSVAKDIAKVLNIKNKGTGYYYNTDYFITYAFGHLIKIDSLENHLGKNIQINDLPVIPKKFNLKPIEDPGIKKQLNIIKKLADKSNKIICATDSGREGELIFRFIYEYLNFNHPILRLWISSLTKEAILSGFKNLQPGSKYDNLFLAAKLRAQSDWLVGLNASYTITKAKNTGQLFSLGRVQTPTLYIIVKRYFEHKNFKKEKYYTTDLNISFNKEIFSLKNNDIKFNDKKIASGFINNLNKKIKVIDIENKKVINQNPLLFDLTALQIIANKKLNFTAQETLNILQNLYEKHKIVSYPRTDSRYLSNDMKKNSLILFSSFLKKLNINVNEHLKTEFLKSRNFNDNKITDHHAIIPTEHALNFNYSNLNEQENNLFNLIKNRFLAAFYFKNEEAKTKIKFEVQNKKNEIFQYFLYGNKTINKGWKIFENIKINEIELPNFKLNEFYNIISFNIIENETKPPALLNDSSLLKLMETAGKEIENEELKESLKDKGLGTPATRSGIIETLIKRNYIKRKGKLILPTNLGIELTGYLLKNKIDLIYPSITAEWEYKLKLVENNNYNYQAFEKEINNYTIKIVSKIKNSIDNFNVQNNIETIKCPNCKTGYLKENSKAFYCSNYNNENNKCNFSLWKTIAGKKLSNNQIKNLIIHKKTKKINGFKSKTGKKFNAKLILTDDNKIKFDFD